MLESATTCLHCSREGARTRPAETRIPPGWRVVGQRLVAALAGKCVGSLKGVDSMNWMHVDPARVQRSRRPKPRAAVRAALSLGLVVLLLVSGCIGKADPLLGKWQASEGDVTATLEFLRDGTVTVTAGPIRATGNYSYPAQGRVRITWGGLWALAGPQVFDYHISGYTLVMTDHLGNTVTYTRAR